MRLDSPSGNRISQARNAAPAAAPAAAPLAPQAAPAAPDDQFVADAPAQARPPVSRDDQLRAAYTMRSGRERTEAVAARSATGAQPTLARGSRGAAVEDLQQKLEQLGHGPGPIDGDFGPQTQAAVRAFQQAQGLKPDGIVGPLTWAAIDRALGGVEPQPPAPVPTPSPVTTIPDRPADAITGSEFIERTRHLSRPQREQAILDEIRKGNVPGFLRNFQQLELSARGSDGQMHTATVKVLPDYLAIGSDEDFVRIPMSSLTAQQIADAFGCVLPTRKLVDEVYRQSDVKLTPIPMKPTSQMMSNEYYLQHQRKIEAQRAGKPLGALTSGHKKDVVLSNVLDAKPDRVAIYGWHQPNGKPIQPLSTVHENTYADYSHGARLIGGTMVVDGVERSVADVLRDPVLSALLSDEGPIRNPRIPM
jgi:peptidoglycan hydrolase-like protein with peptidoglycan-binding domain